MTLAIHVSTVYKHVFVVMGYVRYSLQKCVKEPIRIYVNENKKNLASWPS